MRRHTEFAAATLNWLMVSERLNYSQLNVHLQQKALWIYERTTLYISQSHILPIKKLEVLRVHGPPLRRPYSNGQILIVIIISIDLSHLYNLLVKR